MTGIIGGATEFSGNIIPNDDGKGGQLVEVRYGIQGKDGVQGTTAYTYLSPFDNTGKPTTLAPSNIISPERLSLVNASLPERRPVPTYHPNYLTNSSETNINISRRNRYHKDRLPNASLTGSGGSLKSGEKFCWASFLQAFLLVLFCFKMGGTQPAAPSIPG